MPSLGGKVLLNKVRCKRRVTCLGWTQLVNDRTETHPWLSLASEFFALVVKHPFLSPTSLPFFLDFVLLGEPNVFFPGLSSWVKVSNSHRGPGDALSSCLSVSSLLGWMFLLCSMNGFRILDWLVCGKLVSFITPFFSKSLLWPRKIKTCFAGLLVGSYVRNTKWINK